MAGGTVPPAIRVLFAYRWLWIAVGIVRILTARNLVGVVDSVSIIVPGKRISAEPHLLSICQAVVVAIDAGVKLDELATLRGITTTEDFLIVTNPITIRIDFGGIRFVEVDLVAIGQAVTVGVGI